jgi:signal peptidase I
MAVKSRVLRILVWVATGVLVVALVGRAFFLGYYRIPQNGMYPGLPAGHILFTAKRAYAVPSDVKRGDVVTFLREAGGNTYVFVGRVIGLQGDRVETRGDSLTVNGKSFERQRLREADGKVIYREEIGDESYEVAFDPSVNSVPPGTSVTVPPDHFFVMGDNRSESLDSRHYGPIAFQSIVGKKL